MIEALHQRTSPRLPPEMWWTIALKLDVESLLSLEDSGIIPETFLRSAGLTRTVKLGPHSDIDVLARFLNHIDVTNVKSLCVANCLLVDPDGLFQCLSRLSNLVELDCVNCQLSSGRLFKLLVTSLHALTKLKWSIYEKSCYIELMYYAEIYRGFFVTRLRHMYVEIPRSLKAYIILGRMLKHCAEINHLHIHAISDAYSNFIGEFCTFCIGVLPQLTSFTFTSERAPNNELWRRPANNPLLVALSSQMRHSGLGSTASICGNLVFWSLPFPTCTCVYLEDLASWEEQRIPTDQIILCIEDSAVASEQLTEVAERPWWSQFRHFTLTLLPRLILPHGHVELRRIERALIRPLRTLIDACTYLSELNLSFCHFGRHLDWSDIGASRRTLLVRAVALSQCALKTAVSVERLAASCPMLEELDVCTRSAKRLDYTSCFSCCTSFVSFNRHTVRTLCERTRLQRLALYSASQMSCLNFLSKCSVVQLRLSWQATDTVCCTIQRIALWLNCNRRLRFLTLRSWDVNLTVVCTALCSVDLPSLQVLCIIADTTVIEERVEQSFENIVTKLRLLKLLHAHYIDESYTEMTVTWTRASRPSEPAQRQHIFGGVLIYGAPCLLHCRGSTFIGLAKPQS